MQTQVTEKALISIVVPCYNEKETIPIFYREIDDVSREMQSQVDFELLFIDDGSTDRTLALLRELAHTDKRVRYISFSRNFGKEAGILAGLEAAHGKFVALMDADLQDPPKLLPELYHAVTAEGYDCAATRRVTRQGEPAIRSFFARCFYKLINAVSDTNVVDGARDYRLMRRRVVDAVLSIQEYNRFSKGIFSWVGFRTKWFAYENIERVAGNTKWSFFKLAHYALDGITAFSTMPLAFAPFVGILSCIASFCVFVYLLLQGEPIAGWQGVSCAAFFFGGLQCIGMGILGHYLAKMYWETKRRPAYLIQETERETI